MKKLFAIIALIGLTATAPKLAHSEVAFSIFISNAPPPPRVVFVHQPSFVLVPAEQVYYCDDGYSDYDLFRYGSYYYMYDDGYWYRANSYRGPFVAIRIEYVPSQIFYVSDYGYRWRQAPSWGSRSYSRWDTGDRRFRDWRYNDRQHSSWQSGDRRYAQGAIERRSDGRQYVNRDWQSDRRGAERLSEPWRTRSDARSGVRSDRVVERQRMDSDRDWRDGRSSRDDDADQDRDRGHGKGKGNGKGRGHGHGNGHGNGQGRGND